MKLENMNNAYANKKCTNNIYINNRYTIEVTRKRIKNMYLRVKDTDGTLSVSAPYGMSDTEIRKFVESKSDWIEQTTREMLNVRQLKEQEPVMAPFMERRCVGGLRCSCRGLSTNGSRLWELSQPALR